MSTIKTILYLAFFICLLQLDQLSQLFYSNASSQLLSSATTQLSASSTHTNDTAPDNHSNGYFLEIEEAEEENIHKHVILPRPLTSTHELKSYNLRTAKHLTSKHVEQHVYEHLISWRHRTIDSIVILT